MSRCLALLAFGWLVLLPSATWAQADPRVMYASVVDDKGVPVTGLGPRDFIIREDGAFREILSVEPDRDPMQIALLVDDSRTMRGRENLMRTAVATFIKSLRPDITVALIGLGARPTIRTDYTRDREKLVHAAENLWGEGWNSLYDGIFESSQALAKRRAMRPVILAVSAGGGGYKQRLEVLEALNWAQATLHSVTITPRGGVSNRMLDEATRKTGGRNDVIIGMTSLESKLVDVAAELSNQYRITFARPQRLIPPKTTKIEARNKDLHARGMLLMNDEERSRLKFAWAENKADRK